MAADSAVQAALPGIRNVCQRPYDGKIRENVKVYSEHFSKTGEKEEDFDYETRTEKTVELAQSYYTLVTDFYEYGYGASFHFGPVLDGHRVADCVLAYEKEIAQTLDAKPGKQILVSCMMRCTLRKSHQNCVYSAAAVHVTILARSFSFATTGHRLWCRWTS